MPSLLDSALFDPLAQLVAYKGVRAFIEPNAGKNMDGAEAAARLGIAAYVCESDTEYAALISLHYPTHEIYDGQPMIFLRTILPTIWEPAFFWLDPKSPTHDEELAFIEASAEGQEWYVDFKA